MAIDDLTVRRTILNRPRQDGEIYGIRGEERRGIPSLRHNWSARIWANADRLDSWREAGRLFPCFTHNRLPIGQAIARCSPLRFVYMCFYPYSGTGTYRETVKMTYMPVLCSSQYGSHWAKLHNRAMILFFHLCTDTRT